MKKIHLMVFLSAAVFTAFGYTNAIAEHEAMETRSGQQAMNTMTKVYVCSMDQFTSNKPGDCALCGMKLEEKEMTATDAQAALDKSKEIIQKRA